VSAAKARKTMSEERGFRKLAAWQRAYRLVLAVYKHSQTFPSSELYGLTMQMRRAAISVTANIAEGCERQHRKEFLQFLSVSKGSLAEVETYLMLAKDLGYLSQNDFVDLEVQRKEVGKLLSGLYKSLGRLQDTTRKLPKT
jgi:four helix bundle protein